MRGLRVHATGPQSLVQDLGRPGLAGVGVGRSGAADRGSLRLANRLLGNDESAAAVEVTHGGLEVDTLDEPLWCVLTGAPAPVEVDGRSCGSHALLWLPARVRVRVGAPETGLRSYLAVRGGVDVAPVLGSRSRDVLAGLGPPPLAEGDELPVGPAQGVLPGVDQVPAPRWDERCVELRTVRGPRADWLEEADALVAGTWQVTDRSNRVGARLARWEGSGEQPAGEEVAPLRHAGEAQLPSEGVWRGAVQVPPSGEPVLFLADHPVTGGYPVVGVVVDDDVDRAAQLRPGQIVCFRWVEVR